MPNYTNNLKLEKPLQSENYNIDIFNANADKIDTAIQTVETTVSANKSSILELQNELGTNKTTLQNNINAIREVL